MFAIFIALVMLEFTACNQEVAPPPVPSASSEEVKPSPAKGDVAAQETKTPAPKKVNPRNIDHFAFAAKLNIRLPSLLTSAMVPKDLPQQIQTRLAAAIAHLEKRTALKGRPERPPIDLIYEGTLQTFYELHGYQPVFIDGKGLTTLGSTTFRAIKAADDHGLNPLKYWMDQLQVLVKQSDSLNSGDALTALSLTTDEINTLAARLERKRFDPDADDADDALLEILMNDEDAAVPRLKQVAEDYQNKFKSFSKGMVELEVRLADAWLRYTRDLRHGNLKRLSADEKSAYGKTPKPSDHMTIIQQRLVQELEVISALEETAAIHTHIASLLPEHEQYVKLQQARDRYRGFVKRGGWKPVRKAKLNRRSKSPRIKELKQRLAAEDYFEGEITDVFDDALANAISLYQITHQLKVTGLPKGKSFWGSLNKPAEMRLQEIEVNLRRWHDGIVAPSDYYVYINIPDFHAEVWREGQREMRFRIVVGNKDRRCNPKTKTWEYANATPIQHARMTYLVVNPYWNVPPRIEREEYLDKILEDPTWLDENNFEYHSEKGYTRLRQKPGATNALGQVKFIFPNPHSTFMHDTPLKRLFKHPVRAFSHGCMRVHNPLEFAEYILSKEKKWTPQLLALMEKGEVERQIGLKRPLDVFIDYFTVRVDDQGRAHFLADPYRYVKDAMDPPTARSQRCRPEEKVTRTLSERPIEVLADGTVQLVLPEPIDIPIEGVGGESGVGGVDDGTAPPLPDFFEAP